MQNPPPIRILKGIFVWLCFVMDIAPSQVPEEQNTPEIEQHQKWFDRLAIWELPGPTKNDVAETVIDDLNTGVGYRAQMILSAIIATLGLLTNSTAVVIGAMLIAPILRPIQGLAFSTATGNHKMFMRSLMLLVASVIAGVAMGGAITRLVPFASTTSEILIRTQPTLLDLFVAMASGIIAFLSLGYKKIASGLAGVAMASALVPPLAVIGVGLARFDLSIARGSLILFATNLIAIIIMGVIVLFLFGLSPNDKKNYRASQRRFALIMLLLGALIVPLMNSFTNIGNDFRTKNTIADSTKNYLQTIDPRISLTSSTYTTSSPDTLQVALALQVPQTITLTDTEKLELTQLLASKLDTSVSLQFTITPTVAVQKPTPKTLSTKELIDQTIATYISETDGELSYITSNYIDTAKAYILTLYADKGADTHTHEQAIRTRLEAYNIDEIIIDFRQKKSLPKTSQTKTDTLTTEFRQDFHRFVGTGLILQDLSRNETTDTLSLSLITYIPLEKATQTLTNRQTSLRKNRPTITLDIDIQTRKKLSLPVSTLSGTELRQ